MAADKFMKKLSFLFLKDSDVKTTLVSTLALKVLRLENH